MLLALMLTDDSAALNMCSLLVELNVPFSKMSLCPSANTRIKADQMLRRSRLWWMWAVCFWIVFGRGGDYFPVDLCATFKVHICAKHTWEGNQVIKHAIGGCPVLLRDFLSSRRQGETGICASSTASTHDAGCENKSTRSEGLLFTIVHVTVIHERAGMKISLLILACRCVNQINVLTHTLKRSQFWFETNCVTH